jgi:uncharacterized protein YybS (DUF2232 family)
MTTLLIIASAYVPGLSILLLFLAVPFAYITAKYGVRSGVFSVVLLTVTIMLLLGADLALSIFLTGGINGLCIGSLMRKKVKPSTTIFISTIVFLISVLMAIPFGGEMINQEITKEIDQFAINFSKSLENTISVTDASDVDIKKQQDSINAAVETIRMIVPAIIVITALLSSFINCMLTRIILIASKVEVAQMKKFRFFKLPESIVLGTIIFTGASYLSGKLGIVNSEILLANILVIMLYIYSIQGLALFTYIFLEVKKAILIKSILVITVILSGGLTSLAVIGFIDVVVNTRKLIEKRAG